MSDEQIVDAEVIAAHLPAVRASQAIVARDEITVDDLVAQADKVKQAMERVMHDGIHYGKVPGVSKPTLLKPGAETLCVLLRLAPAYESERIWHDDGHLTVVSKVTLHHIPTGLTVAEGEGLCSSREQKYAVRKAERLCPACGADAIIKGKAEYGGGWLCFKKKGGCGAKFADGDAAVEGQEVGEKPNPNLADTFNTVLKMANKRALVAAVLNGTAASDIFTQDVEDLAGSAVSPGTADGAQAAGGGAPPTARSSVEPADLALWQYADRLTVELIDLADQLDATDVTRGAVEKNRGDHDGDPEKHVAWLNEQLERARTAVAALHAKDDLFPIPDSAKGSEAVSPPAGEA